MPKSGAALNNCSTLKIFSLYMHENATNDNNNNNDNSTINNRCGNNNN